MESALRRGKESVHSIQLIEQCSDKNNDTLVTDMLLAMLNCCTKEELEESSDEEALTSPARSEESVDSAERRKIIKNKILAVGRMSRVFALLRYASSIPLCTYNETNSPQ